MLTLFSKACFVVHPTYLPKFGILFTRLSTECAEKWNTKHLTIQLVARFDKALEDPEKVTELKAILRMLCHETSYVEECKVFVGRLDYFIEHIKPYLVTQFLSSYCF